MVVKIYISGISGNKEVKKRQQRVLLILDSRSVKYEVIDIAEPGNEERKDFMQNNSTAMGVTIGDPNPRHALPPQIFNDDIYCGDYDQFDMANEVDEMEKFLKLAPDETKAPVTTNAEIKLGNGEIPADNGDTKDSKQADEIVDEAKDPSTTDIKSSDKAEEENETAANNNEQVGEHAEEKEAEKNGEDKAESEPEEEEQSKDE